MSSIQTYQSLILIFEYRYWPIINNSISKYTDFSGQQGMFTKSYNFLFSYEIGLSKLPVHTLQPSCRYFCIYYILVYASIYICHAKYGKFTIYTKFDIFCTLAYHSLCSLISSHLSLYPF